MANLFEIKDTPLSLDFNEDSIITVYLKGDVNKLDIHFNNGTYKVLIFDNTSNDNVINDNYYLSNAVVEIYYIYVRNNNLVQNSKYDLNKDSNLKINTTYLGINSKKIVYNINHNQRDTESNITNEVVCLDEASFDMEVIGNIFNGCKNSNCYQKSNCLTMGNPKLARILPVLNIDENDVQASHSLSSGTIDQEIMFYMNSRGLSSKAALELILNSYLLPNEEFYNEYPDGMNIKELVEREVNSCLK